LAHRWVTDRSHHEQLSRLDSHVLASECSVCHAIHCHFGACALWSLAGSKLVIRHLLFKNSCGPHISKCPWREYDAQSQEARAEHAMQTCKCYEPGMRYTKEHIASIQILQCVTGIACLFWPTTLHCSTSVLAGLTSNIHCKLCDLSQDYATQQTLLAY